MTIKGFRPIVLRIDDHGIYRDFGSSRTFDRIPEERAAEFQAMVFRCNCQTPASDHGDRGVPRQTLREFGRQIREEHSSCGEGIVPGDPAGRDFARDEACGDATADVLARVFPKIPVEGLDSASKAGAVIVRREWLHGENEPVIGTERSGGGVPGGRV
jgi:hypothetical protein